MKDASQWAATGGASLSAACCFGDDDDNSLPLVHSFLSAKHYDGFAILFTWEKQETMVAAHPVQVEQLWLKQR